jgi:hypothetical protein
VGYKKIIVNIRTKPPNNNFTGLLLFQSEKQKENGNKSNVARGREITNQLVYR